MLVDRIVAVVDDRPLMLSEARVLQALRGLGEEQAVEALVDEHLMEREAARLPRTAPSPEEEDRALASLAARLAATAESGPSPGEAALRPVARRQVTILKYVEYRFRPQVRVPEEAVRRAWSERAWPGAQPPSFESVAEQIRGELERDELDRRLEAWVAELRQAARVRRNPVR